MTSSALTCSATSSATSLGGALAQLADLATAQFICTPYGPRALVQHIYAFRPRELEALTQLHEFARDIWRPWQTTFMTGMQAALGHEIYPAADAAARDGDPSLLMTCQGGRGFRGQVVG